MTIVELPYGQLHEICPGVVICASKGSGRRVKVGVEAPRSVRVVKGESEKGGRRCEG